MLAYPVPKPVLETLALLDNSVAPIVAPVFAKADLEVILDFLKQYNGNQTTFSAYRREIERLLQWAWLIAKKSVLAIKRQEIQSYLEFCLNPPLAWIGVAHVPRFIEQRGERQANPNWRPFVATIGKQAYRLGKRPDKRQYRLSQKALQEIFTILSSFYHFLLLDEKVLANPLDFR